jgi:hypothetical protein
MVTVDEIILAIRPDSYYEIVVTATLLCLLFFFVTLFLLCVCRVLIARRSCVMAEIVSEKKDKYAEEVNPT